MLQTLNNKFCYKQFQKQKHLYIYIYGLIFKQYILLVVQKKKEVEICSYNITPISIYPREEKKPLNVKYILQPEIKSLFELVVQISI